MEHYQEKTMVELEIPNMKTLSFRRNVERKALIDLQAKRTKAAYSKKSIYQAKIDALFGF